jgi:hypothetical protein
MLTWIILGTDCFGVESHIPSLMTVSSVTFHDITPQYNRDKSYYSALAIIPVSLTTKDKDIIESTINAHSSIVQTWKENGKRDWQVIISNNYSDNNRGRLPEPEPETAEEQQEFGRTEEMRFYEHAVNLNITYHLKNGFSVVRNYFVSTDPEYKGEAIDELYKKIYASNDYHEAAKEALERSKENELDRRKNDYYEGYSELEPPEKHIENQFKNAEDYDLYSDMSSSLKERRIYMEAGQSYMSILEHHVYKGVVYGDPLDMDTLIKYNDEMLEILEDKGILLQFEYPGINLDIKAVYDEMLAEYNKYFPESNTINSGSQKSLELK